MRNHDDQPMYRTFEEFEREELFDGMFADELDFDAASVRFSRHAEADDEE
jgi:hypothetical protein